MVVGELRSYRGVTWLTRIITAKWLAASMSKWLMSLSSHRSSKIWRIRKEERTSIHGGKITFLWSTWDIKMFLLKLKSHRCTKIEIIFQLDDSLVSLSPKVGDNFLFRKIEFISPNHLFRELFEWQIFFVIPSPLRWNKLWWKDYDEALVNIHLRFIRNSTICFKREDIVETIASRPGRKDFIGRTKSRPPKSSDKPTRAAEKTCGTTF